MRGFQVTKVRCGDSGISVWIEDDIDTAPVNIFKKASGWERVVIHSVMYWRGFAAYLLKYPVGLLSEINPKSRWVSVQLLSCSSQSSGAVLKFDSVIV